jgi:hypothetical protein
MFSDFAGQASKAEFTHFFEMGAKARQSLPI